MNNAFVDYLKTKEDIQTDTHSGSYELVRQGVVFLAKVSPEKIDVSDLLMLFEFGNLGHGKKARDEKILASNLLDEDKEYMLDLNARINAGVYTNHEAKSNGNCGLFARGYRQLHVNSDKETAQEFIKMLISISKIDDSEDILRITGECLSKNLRGMQAGVASQILHLLKPTIFPILNDPGRNGYINKLGLHLVKASDIHQYIHNVKIIRDFKDKELPSINYRTIDVAFWDNQIPINESISYWLGGATYGAPVWDVSQKFIDNGIYAIDFEKYDIADIVSEQSKFTEWVDNLTDNAAKKAFTRFSQMKTGDQIAIKSSFPKTRPNKEKYVSTLRIKAIGTVLDDFETGYLFDEDLGHTVPVKWDVVNIKNDLGIGTYRDTIHQVTKQEDIDAIFHGKPQYLMSEFLEWLKTQKSQHGKPFSPNTVDQYRGALKNRCKALVDLNLPQPDLFYQTDAVAFRELRGRIEKSVHFESENIKAGNGSFSAGMELYEKFLRERETEDIPSSVSEEQKMNYWWLNANPKIWSFSEIRVGEEIDYSLLNENGNKRRIYQNFLDAKAGDCVIGYESTPAKQIVARCKISKENDGKSLYFEKIEGLSVPIEYNYIKDIPELQQMEYFANPQGSLFKLTKDEYELLLDIIREQNPVSTSESEEKEIYTKNDFLSEVYMTSEKYDDITALLNRKKNIILQGAPGVGKSFLAKRLAYSIIGSKDKNRVEVMQFHQSYSYEDFIEGYRPDGDGGFVLKNGVFYNFCERAKNNEGNHYFIIDEINRGNLSKIMGELMLLIECDKRGKEFAVPLTYSGKMFFVPENVHIIGMMNTADRSLAMIDYALRRRFSFIPIEPAFSNPDFIKYIKKDDEALGEKILAEMNALNVDIKNDLGAGFQIGHSYFCNCDDINGQWYESVLKYEILPLLDEYWFDNEKQHSKWVKGLLSDEKNPD